MVAVSLTGHLRVNLADSSPNGCIYPWIGERPETPDLRSDDREVFQYISKMRFA